MSDSKVIYPSEVFTAIAEAKRRNPADKFGDGAFEIPISNMRAGKNSVRYLPFNVLRQDPASKKWEYVPLNMKFMNLNTTASIYPPESEKKKYAGARLQFTMKNTSFQRIVKTQKGKAIMTEEFGLAKVAVYNAFKRIMQRILKEKKIYHAKDQIASSIQTERITDKNTQMREALAKGDEIIRIEIPFNKTSDLGSTTTKILTSEKPKCDIYDVTRVKENVKKGYLPYELGTFVEFADDGSETPVDITYGNIHKYITYGSSCSGVDCMDSVCLSQQGISLPSKVSLLAVKRSFGRKPEATSVFSSDEFSEMAAASTIEEPLAETSEESTSGNTDDITEEYQHLEGVADPDNFDPDPEIDTEDIADE